MPTDLQPGLIVLHGNRLELLAETVFAWQQRQPLGALEEEVFLVQSNGMAEWLKMSLATHSGICAATRVELPARFLWRSCRQLLGPDAVPPQSALDKLPLTWRLMALLPALAPQRGFEPLAGFLGDGDAARRLQLAARLADLFDQYQVHRADWLEAWAGGQDVLPRGPGVAAAPLPPAQAWQPRLWRALLAPLDPAQAAALRPRLQARFLAALADGAATPPVRRVTLFGMSHVPTDTLQALAALSRCTQVVIAVPNPCRYHWADIIDGRELLAAARRRQPLRGGVDLAAVDLSQMHAHAHPLLAAWGRQGRDFVRQLDAFDDARLAQQRFALPRIDLFDDGPGHTLLQQVQARIRDLVPLHEHAAAAAPLADDDRSIVFQVAHGALRELEILHDQLLQLLAQPPGGQPLQPRDIVVMVPDIEVFAPAIRAIFGQWPRADARHIPFDIADLRSRGRQPLLVALEWLLRLPQQRVTLSELRDLLEVPALARRFGLAEDERPRLAAWLEGAGMRWGLHEAHRAALGLAACGEPNSARFGLRRLLAGYALGDLAQEADAALAGAGGRGEIEPHAEVGGLEAALAGSLADLLAALDGWWAQCRDPAPPALWAARGRALLDRFFDAGDERERAALSAAHEALRAWLDACAAAGFEQPVELAVAREAWLGGVDEPALGRRFRAGGVTFCTLMPMRAIPFEVVCLLGMNDGDYPRRAPRGDFDLMGLPGQQRPGDRSRRDDDRQLMLEALLAARRVLYVSWAGRSVRDHSRQPPSVLVSQLRDYLDAGWGAGVVAARTTEHPLQPFSRRYFEADPAAAGRGPTRPLFTHALEWRAAHAGATAAAPAAPVPAAAESEPTVDLAALQRFLRNPVQDHFRQRLKVNFDDSEAADDDEPFGLAGLPLHGLLRDLLAELQRAADAATAADDAVLVDRAVRRARRAGRLPLGAPGARAAQELVVLLQAMLRPWRAWRGALPKGLAPRRLHLAGDGWVLDDRLDGLRAPADADPAGALDGAAWLVLEPGRLFAGRKSLRGDRLLGPWLRQLAAAACGLQPTGLVVARDAWARLPPLPGDAARATLADLLQVRRMGLQGDGAPLPLALRTALATVQGRNAEQVYNGSHFAAGLPGEGREPCLARVFPDHAALVSDGRHAALAQRVYGPLSDWLQHAVEVEPLPDAPADDDAEAERD